MDTTFSIAVRGLQQASLRLNAAATNIVTMRSSSAGQTVSAPDADLPAQVVTMIQAKAEFAANVAVIKASDRMYRSLLDVIA